MTQTDNNLNQLIINELTQAEYDAATINQNELYVVTDGVMQSTDVINALGYTPVNKAGDTMTGNLRIDNTPPILYLRNTAEVAGTTPSSQQIKQITFQDSNGTTVGYVANQYNTNGGRVTVLNCRNANATENAVIAIGYDGNGNLYTMAPTPASTSNGTNIATTEFCDGNWTKVPTASCQVASSVSLNYASDYSISLASILPNTADLYEILVTGNVTSGTTNGNFARIYLGAGYASNVCLCMCRTRSSSSVEAAGTAIIQMYRSDALLIRRTSDTNLKGTANLWILAYRKVR